MNIDDKISLSEQRFMRSCDDMMTMLLLKRTMFYTIYEFDYWK